MRSHILTSLIMAGVALVGSVGLDAETPHIIPAPKAVETAKGSFKIPADGVKYISVTDIPSEATLRALDNALGSYDKKLTKAPSVSRAEIVFEKYDWLDPEGYSLAISPAGITVAASTDAGMFYGVKTLEQLLRQYKGVELPSMTISDKPRFAYRGLMLDAVRYFMPLEQLKRTVDIASSLKLNNLHLHLTDDNGWRLEIKKYPRLTEVGAWRVDRPEIFPARKNATEGEPATYGGYYTQDEMRQLVEYAAERHVNIIPEIEMPAHAVAALASYPELTCPVQTEFFGVLPGIGGKAASIIACAGNDSTYTFYEDVLDEVMDIFPSEYIHLGGDEAEKSHWEECPKCQKRFNELGLNDIEELQGYFMDRINRHIASKGRKAIGWDEVVLGKPKEDFTVMGWRGLGKTAVDGAREKGNDFILTPALKLYLIRYQGPQQFEPYTYFGNNTLADVYSYEAVEQDWTPQLLSQYKGIQGSLWTEFCHSENDVDYLLYPRVFALADNAWRQKGAGNWEEFLSALDTQLPMLADKGATYARSMYNLFHSSEIDSAGNITVALRCIRPDMEIRTGVDSLSMSTPYTTPLTLGAEPTQICAATFDGGNQMGRMLRLDYRPSLTTAKKIDSPASRVANINVLVDGLRGSDRATDGQWAMFYNSDIDLTIDLGDKQPFNEVSVGTLANIHVGMAAPKSFSVEVSDDGEHFRKLQTLETTPEQQRPDVTTVRDYTFSNLKAKGRYIRLKAESSGAVPDGYPREGMITSICLDEISVK